MTCVTSSDLASRPLILYFLVTYSTTGRGVAVFPRFKDLLCDVHHILEHVQNVQIGPCLPTRVRANPESGLAFYGCACPRVGDRFSIVRSDGFWTLWPGSSLPDRPTTIGGCLGPPPSYAGVSRPTIPDLARLSSRSYARPYGPSHGQPCNRTDLRGKLGSGQHRGLQTQSGTFA